MEVFVFFWFLRLCLPGLVAVLEEAGDFTVSIVGDVADAALSALLRV
jgi:hypothetical protein